MIVPSLLRSLSSLNSGKSKNGEEASKYSTEKISIPLLALFLQKKIAPNVPSSEIEFFAEAIDIDRDGFIGKDDLETFIKRGSIHSHSNDGYNSPHFVEKISLYPTEPLTEAEVQLILKDLRYILGRRKITNYDLFMQLDKNEDGFLTIDDFKGLDHFINIPQHAKEGLFAYMDKLKIGIIDYPRFLKVMNKSIYVLESVSILPIFLKARKCMRIILIGH
jgi:hypothetical protein